MLLPFRAHALAFVRALCALLPPIIEQVENKARFEREYSEEEGAAPMPASKPAALPAPSSTATTTTASAADSDSRARRPKLYAPFYAPPDLVIASPLGGASPPAPTARVEAAASIGSRRSRSCSPGTPRNSAQFGAIRRNSAQFADASPALSGTRRPGDAGLGDRPVRRLRRAQRHADAGARHRLLARALVVPRLRRRRRRRRRSSSPPTRPPSSRRSPSVAPPPAGRTTPPDVPRRALARVPRGWGASTRSCRFDADDPATAADARLRAFSARILPSIVRSLADGADTVTLLFVPSASSLCACRRCSRASRRPSPPSPRAPSTPKFAVGLARAPHKAWRWAAAAVVQRARPLLPPPPLPGRAQPRAPERRETARERALAHRHA